MIKFKASSPHVKQMRNDGGYRVEFDVSESEFEQMKEMMSPSLHGVVLEISIEQSSDLTV